MIFFLLSVEKGQPCRLEDRAVGWKTVTSQCVWLRHFGIKVLGFLSCMPNELPCWGYSAHVGVAALVWRLLGDMSQWAWLCLGCRGHPAQIHKGTVKDLGLAELSTLPTALWSLCGSVKSGECGLWVQEGWPSLHCTEPLRQTSCFCRQLVR